MQPGAKRKSLNVRNGRGILYNLINSHTILHWTTTTRVHCSQGWFVMIQLLCASSTQTYCETILIKTTLNKTLQLKVAGSRSIDGNTHPQNENTDYLYKTMTKRHACRTNHQCKTPDGAPCSISCTWISLMHEWSSRAKGVWGSIISKGNVFDTHFQVSAWLPQSETY